jgi:hypothetical protein
MCERAINEPIMIRPLKLFVPTEITTYEPTPSSTLLPLTIKQSVCPSNSKPEGFIVPSRRHDTIAVTTRKSIGVKVHEPFVSERDTFFIGELLDRIRLSRRTGLIAPYVMTRKEDTIARNNLAWLEQCHITNNYLVYVDLPFCTITNDLYKTIFFLLVEAPEIASPSASRSANQHRRR